MPAPRITLYSTRNCPHCRQLKQYLQQRGLRFQEFDVQNDPRGRKAYARLGARTVPVVIIGDTRVDGFDRRRLDRLLDGADPA